MSSTSYSSIESISNKYSHFNNQHFKMYKLSLVVLLIAAGCTALPEGDEATQYEAAPRGDRVARATCDLLSASAGGVALNHSACAAHCLYIGNGYKGGRCIDGICHCRK